MGFLQVLPRALAAMMASRGLSQTELAQRAGVDRSKLSGYLRGRWLPHLRTLEKLLLAMDADFGDLHHEIEIAQGRVPIRPAERDEPGVVGREEIEEAFAMVVEIRRENRRLRRQRDELLEEKRILAEHLEEAARPVLRERARKIRARVAGREPGETELDEKRET